MQIVKRVFQDIHRWLYLHAKWPGDDGSHVKAMGLHHELSSILYKLNKDQFNEEAWRQVNSSKFGYTFEESTDRNIRTGNVDLVGNDDLYRAGFLCKHGQLTLEDDINTFAQHLIAKPSLLKHRMATHTRIRRKAKLLSDFLQLTGYVKANHSAK